jgi:energy-converting hydrogenase A subunit M
MRARKIEKIDSFIYLLSSWKYTYSKDVFLRLRAKKSGHDIYDFRFARLLPAINLDRLFLRAIRLGQALKITLDENSDIMFRVISFAASDKNLIVSTLDKAPYRVINIVESNNRWIVNALQFHEADSTIRCGSFFLREFGEFIGKAIAVVRCPRSRIELVDFGKKEAREITNNIKQIGYMLTISRKNRANVVEDIETITSNDKHELINMLKKKLAQRKEDTQLAKT